MKRALTIAQLSDVHLSPITGFTPRYWNLKRASGYYNWSRHRRLVHQREVLDRIVADVAAQRPDHIVVTGDLVNIGLPQEHIAALGWLQTLGTPDHVTVIPGNHDVYSRIGRDPGTRRWAEYMTSDAEGASFVPGSYEFPFVRLLGSIAIIGVNSAVPTAPFMAWGRLGREQLMRLSQVLEALGKAGLFRVLLIHHPPLPGQCSRARGLQDAAALEAILKDHGAELVLHGHNHINMLAWATGPGGRFPVVGVPSASHARQHGNETLGRYNLYQIDPVERAILMTGRGLETLVAPVGELETRVLTAPPLDA